MRRIPTWASFPSTTPELARLRVMVEATAIEQAPDFNLAAAIWELHFPIEVEESTGFMFPPLGARLVLTDGRGEVEMGLDPRWTPYLRAALEVQE